MRALLRRLLRQPDLTVPVASAGRAHVNLGEERPLIYAIGDVHGCHDALLALEERIRADAAGMEESRPLIVYLGDYVDRGPHSKEVLEHIARADHGDGIERLALCGNHDDAFLQFIQNPASNIAWLDFGGDATLRSYGLGRFSHSRKASELHALRDLLLETVPERHIRCLERLPALAVQGDRVFVHAGIRPGIALADQDEGDLLWIREPFLDVGPDMPITVIHGHTAGIEPVFAKGRICIDTGCYATGKLTALKVTAHNATVL